MNNKNLGESCSSRLIASQHVAFDEKTSLGTPGLGNLMEVQSDDDLIEFENVGPQISQEMNADDEFYFDSFSSEKKRNV